MTFPAGRYPRLHARHLTLKDGAEGSDAGTNDHGKRCYDGGVLRKWGDDLILWA